MSLQVALNALRHARTSFGLSVQAHEMEEALHYAFASHQDDSDSARAKVGDWGSRTAAPVN